MTEPSSGVVALFIFTVSCLIGVMKWATGWKDTVEKACEMNAVNIRATGASVDAMKNGCVSCRGDILERVARVEKTAHEDSQLQWTAIREQSAKLDALLTGMARIEGRLERGPS